MPASPVRHLDPPDITTFVTRLEMNIPIYITRFTPRNSEPAWAWGERELVVNGCLIPHIIPRPIPRPSNDNG